MFLESVSKIDSMEDGVTDLFLHDAGCRLVLNKRQFCYCYCDYSPRAED